MPKTEKQIIYQWKKKKTLPSYFQNTLGQNQVRGKKVLHDEILLKKHKI